MVQSLTAHFSKRVLLLSIIVILSNLGIYALKSVSSRSAALESMAPRLISATIDELEIKSPFDDKFRSAAKGQQVFSGTTIKTSEAEFAELVLGNNVIRLDESTEVELLGNDSSRFQSYAPDSPRLILALKSGGVWVNAFDLIQIQTPRSQAELHHAVGIITYSAPINRAMVITGDLDMSLLGEKGEKLSEFVVPLHNQITFLDSQITPVYEALKPSKLKKELKMTPLSNAVLEDEWVARNANEFVVENDKLQSTFIQSGLAYKIRKAFHTGMGYLTFNPEAKRNLALKEVETLLGYLLGGVQSKGDMIVAEQLITDFESLIAARKSDALMKELIVRTLFAIEGADFGSPAFALKEALMGQVESSEGTYVYRVYLTDFRRALFTQKISVAESIINKWQERWTDGRIKENLAEYARQNQILNHTLLSFIDRIPLSMLEVYDKTSEKIMAFATDREEARFQVIQDRLQIAASLVTNYRYVLAKQYLKNSYLSLNIEAENPNLASTKIFLENGRLLAQRIQYAEEVLHGAASPIDETQFRDYFQAKTRDKAFTQDLRTFFELGEEEIIISSAVDAPSVAQVAERFQAARINVNYTDISLIEGAGFSYKILGARLMDRGSKNETLSFVATYDYQSNSVSEVVVDGRPYRGGFTLSDLVLVLMQGDKLTDGIYAPTSDASGLDLLLTNDEKSIALEGQLVAQDVARKLASSELEAVGISIPDVKSNIEILDKLNLDKFRIKNAVIKRTDSQGTATINFVYNSQTSLVTEVQSVDGFPLLEAVAAPALASEVTLKIKELEKALEAVSSFSTFAKQNDLYIDSTDVVYTGNGQLQLTGLEMLNLGLKVSALYDTSAKTFVFVSHELLTAENIDLKKYFESLADLYVSLYMAGKGVSVTESQIVAVYPFSKISLKQVDVSGVSFNFDLDLLKDKLLKVQQIGSSTVTEEMTIEELLQLADKASAVSVPSLELPDSSTPEEK